MRKGERCIAHVVCSGAHITKERWNLFRETVRENIRVRRANCNTALKKDYLGKKRFIRECLLLFLVAIVANYFAVL